MLLTKYCRCNTNCNFSWYFFNKKIKQLSCFIFIDTQKCLITNFAFITIRLLNTIFFIILIYKRANLTTWQSCANSPQTLNRVEIFGGKRVGNSLLPVINWRLCETQPKRVFTSNSLTFWSESSIWLLWIRDVFYKSKR
jgi:hypothetical protein